LHTQGHSYATTGTINKNQGISEQGYKEAGHKNKSKANPKIYEFTQINGVAVR
jgi:hypothetical protein